MMRSVRLEAVLAMALLVSAGCANAPEAPTATVTVSADMTPAAQFTEAEQRLIDYFFDVVDPESHETPEDVVSLAHSVCDAFGREVPGAQVYDSLKPAFVTRNRTISFLIPAVHALCPEYDSVVDEIIADTRPGE